MSSPQRWQAERIALAWMSRMAGDTAETRQLEALQLKQLSQDSPWASHNSVNQGTICLSSLALAEAQ